MLDYTDLLGKPFVLGGRGPNEYDCWGICMNMGLRFNPPIIYPDIMTPNNVKKRDEVICGTIDEIFEKIETPEPGTIVVIRMHPPLCDHCGIILPDNFTFLHTLFQHSVVRVRLDHWKRRIHGFYRLKNANN